MSVVVITTTPGLTAELYDQVIARLGNGGALPPDCTFRLAGPSPDGWRVASVWSNGEAADRFASETLRPIMADLGVAPPTTPPLVYPVHEIIGN